jgi:hypothetical protein
MSRTGCDLEDGLCDLLADLMHWSDKCGIDFAEAFRRACDHYVADRTEEGTL